MYIVTELNDLLEDCCVNLQVRYTDEGDITLIFNGIEFYPNVGEIKQIIKVLNKAIRDVK